MTVKPLIFMCLLSYQRGARQATNGRYPEVVLLCSASKTRDEGCDSWADMRERHLGVEGGLTVAVDDSDNGV